MNSAAKASFARARRAIARARIWREKADLMQHLVESGFTELRGTDTAMRAAEQMYVQMALALRVAAKLEASGERIGTAG